MKAYHADPGALDFEQPELVQQMLEQSRRDPAYAAWLGDSLNRRLSATISHLLSVNLDDHDDLGPLNHACSIMHRLIICQVYGVDNQGLRGFGHALYDKYAEAMFAQTSLLTESLTRSHESGVVVMKTLDAVSRTLDSPIEDTEKLDHLRDLVKKGRVGEALIKWRSLQEVTQGAGRTH